MKLCNKCDIVYNEPDCPLCKERNLRAQIETELLSIKRGKVEPARAVLDSATPEGRGYLDREHAAMYLGKTLSTLQWEASVKKHKIPYYMFGRKCYYKIKDLDAFLESTRRGG